MYTFRMQGPALLLCCLALALAPGCATTHKVHDLSQVHKFREVEGVAYALPRTVIDVEVPLIRVVTVQGKWVNYAYLLGISVVPLTDVNAIRMASDKKEFRAAPAFQIGDITASAFAEADESAMYWVELATGVPSNSTLMMTWGKQGVPTKSKSESENMTLDYALKATEVFFKVGTAVATSGASLARMSLAPTAIAQPVGVDEPTDEIRRTAARIKWLESQIDGRLAQLSGVDSQVAQIFTAEMKGLAEERDSHLKHFVITQEVKPFTVRFEVRPDGASPMAAGTVFPLFRFGTKEGIKASGATQVSVLRAIPSIFSAGSGDEMYQIRFTADRSGQLSHKVASLAMNNPDSERGFRYRQPYYAVAAIERSHDAQAHVAWASRVPVSQWGTIMTLPVKLPGGKKFSHELTFDEFNGSLSSINLSLTAPAASSVDGVVGALTGFIEGTGPLASLERESKRLELESTIEKAQRAKIQAMLGQMNEASE